MEKQKITAVALIVIALSAAMITLNFVHAANVSPSGTISVVEANSDGTTYSPVTSSWVQSAPSSPMGNLFPNGYTFIGDTVYVNILISNVAYAEMGTGSKTVATTGIYGWFLDLNWSPSTLNLTGVQEGSYLKQGGATLVIGDSSALFDNVHGALLGGASDGYASSQVLSMKGANAVNEVSSGVLLQLQFAVTGAGTGMISVSDAILYDSASDATSGKGVAATLGPNADVTLNIQNVPLTVNSAYGSPNPAIGTTNYFDGQTVTATAPSQTIINGDIYICTGWTGTGSVYTVDPVTGSNDYSGNGNSVTFTIDSTQGTSTLTWIWANSGNSGAWLTVISSYGNPNPSVGNHIYTIGTTVTATVSGTVTIGGDVYYCYGWSGTGSVPENGILTTTTFTITETSTITWNWMLASTPTTSPTGVVSAVQNGTSNVSNWSYGPTQDPIGTTFNVDLRIDNASNIWGWAISGLTWNPAVLQLTDVQEGSYLNNNHSTFFLPYGYLDNVDGILEGGIACAISDSQTATENASSGVLATLTFQIVGYGESNIDILSPHLLANGADDLGSSAASKDATISVLSSIPLYIFTVNTILLGSNYYYEYIGNVSPAGNASYVYGSTINASVAANFYANGYNYVCVGWEGSGSVPATGTGNSVVFTITENSSITWLWQSYESSPPSSPPSNPPSTPKPSGVLNVVEGGTTDVSYLPFGPSSNLVGTSFTVDIRIENGSNIWGWAIGDISWNPAVVQLTQVQDGSYLNGNDVIFLGSDTTLFDNVNGEVDGGIACGSLVPSVVNASSGVLATLTFQIVGYGNADIHVGDATLVQIASPFPNYYSINTNDADVTVINSVPMCVLSTSTIETDGNNAEIVKIGNPLPIGTPSYTNGSTVTACVTSPYVNGDIYSCTGWVGTGSVPASGTGTSVSFIITQNSTITWLWQDITSPPPQSPSGTISLVQSGTFNVLSWSYGPNPSPIGTIFTVDIRIDNASNVAGWTLSGLTWNPAVVKLTGISEGNYLSQDYTTGFFNGSLTDNVNGILQGDIACFIENNPVATENASSGVLATLTFQITGYGNTNIDVTQLILDSSTTDIFTSSLNSAFVSAQSSSPLFSLSTSTLTQVQDGELVNVGNPTPIGEPSYTSGATVTASVTSPFYDGYNGITYTCTGWVGTGDIPASGTGSSVTFTITQDSTITWFWQTNNPAAPPAPTGTLSVVQSGTNDVSTLSFNSASTPLGNTFSIDVRIDGASNVVAWYIANFSWNPAVVQLVQVQQGNYMSDRSTFFIGSSSELINNTSGQLIGGLLCEFADSLIPESATSGVLATLTFQIIGYGNANICVENATLYDIGEYDDGVIQLAQFQPSTSQSTVTVLNSVFVMPEYSWGALTALISSLISFAVFAIPRKRASPRSSKSFTPENKKES